MTKATQASTATERENLPELMPRSIKAGPLILDLFHRDARIGRRWARFHPREFEVVWRLAETPRVTISRQDLLRDVWRLDHDPGTNRVEVNISRVRSKLHRFNLAWLIVTNSQGGYWLDVDPTEQSLNTDDSSALDSC